MVLLLVVAGGRDADIDTVGHPVALQLDADAVAQAVADRGADDAAHVGRDVVATGINTGATAEVLVDQVVDAGPQADVRTGHRLGRGGLRCQ